MASWWARHSISPAALAVAVMLTAGCGGAPLEPSSATPPTTSGVRSVVSSATPAPRRSTSSPVERPAAPGPLIVIDPGHSGKAIRSTATHGLRDIDYPNYPEIYEMFDVSTCVARALRFDGYRVKLTKAHVLSSVSHSQRAAVANTNHAALAISVHDDHGVSARFEHTYDQRGTRRSDGSYPAMYRGTGSQRLVYDHPDTAKRSQTYAQAIARARTTARQRSVTVAQNSYDGRFPLEPGNLALVQLFSTVPWVYNEMGALTAGRTGQAMSIDSETAYAVGLLTGVEAAVPLVAGRANPPTSSASTLHDCLVQQVQPESGRLTRPRKYLPYHFEEHSRP